MVESKPKFDIKAALAMKLEPYEVEFTNNDSILYALAIGFQ